MERATPHVGHENRDISVRGVVLAAIALAAVALVSVGLVTRLFVYLNREAARAQDPLPMPREAALPAEPRIQPDPAGALLEMRVEESRILDAPDAYRWVDKEAGVVRIPIDRAMKVILERGLLTPKAPAEPAKTEPQRD